MWDLEGIFGWICRCNVSVDSKILDMRRIFAVCVWFVAMGAMAGEPVELITYNIRMNTPGDGEHAWPHRKAEVVALLRFHRADIFSVQEALPGQMDDLAAAFH